MNNHLGTADVTLQGEQFVCRRIVERLIVYSCFVAHTNLDTFMISLRAHSAIPCCEEKGGGWGIAKGKRAAAAGTILTPGFLEPVSSDLRFRTGPTTGHHERTVNGGSKVDGICMVGAGERRRRTRIIEICANEPPPFLPASAKWKLKVILSDLTLLSAGNRSKCTVLSALMRQSSGDGSLKDDLARQPSIRYLK